MLLVCWQLLSLRFIQVSVVSFFFLLLLLFIVSRKAVHDFRKCVPAVEITEKNERDCREEMGIDKRYTACVFMYSCLISSGV